ncbi:MAG: hypothetical protein RBR47_09955, partial [Bacteroidales bacterium]|nr:hypothetical protein [Bacteroidales bacterium]
SNTKTTEKTEKETIIFLCFLCVFSAPSAVNFLAIEIKYKNHRVNREENANFPLCALRLPCVLCG